MYLKRNADELRLSEKRKPVQNQSGYLHRFYSQYYKGVRVEGGEVSIHAKNGNIETVFGDFQTVGDIAVEPSLSEAEALSAAMQYIGAEIYKWQVPEEEAWIKEYYNDTYYPAGELVVVKGRLNTEGTYRLAYRFDIAAHKPMSRDYVWVDAVTGSIIDIASRISFANATGTAATRYSGTRTITTDSYNGRYRLRETRNGVNISTFNMNHTGTYSSTDFTDNDNNWTAAEHHNTNKDDAALDAHWGAEMVYDYFKQVHLRDSWNNNNGPLLSYVNGYLPSISSVFGNSNNAFWSVDKMTYGEGTSFPPFVALDIVAHEIGHAVCQSSAGLGKTGQPGAINESLSDIWGACVEHWATTGKSTWLCGEDLGTPHRSMSNPKLYGDPNTYLGNNWYSGIDNSVFVHRNCGVMNYWFYLLSQGGDGVNDLGNYFRVIGIGIEDAAKIVYEAETGYMIPTTGYSTIRSYTIQAAENLYGVGSSEAHAVACAWYAVGIGSRAFPPSISASHPGYICSYVNCGLSDLPSGITGSEVTWTCTPDLILEGGSNTGLTKTFYVVPSTYSGVSSVTAHFRSTTLNRTIYILKPTGTSYIEGASSLNLGAYGNYALANIVPVELEYGSPLRDCFCYAWTCSPNLEISYEESSIGLELEDLDDPGDPDDEMFMMSFGEFDYPAEEDTCMLVEYKIHASVHAIGCGPGWIEAHVVILGGTITVRKYISVVNCVGAAPAASAIRPSYALVYPNPVSDILTIEFDPNVIAQVLESQKRTQGITFDVRLYDSQGQQLRQATGAGGSISFNTSGLSNGVYFVHIYDGIGAKPEIRQIIVQH